MGWREFLLCLILAIVAYMVWLLLRMRSLGRSKKAARPPKEPPSLKEPHVTNPADYPENATRLQGNGASDMEADMTMSQLREDLRERFDRHFSHTDHEKFPYPEDTDNASSWLKENIGGIAQEAFMDGVERELEQVREEFDALRGALPVLRDEIADLREVFQQEILAIRATQNASPLYNDAMQMAILGHDAVTIAERCGISRAEAELVVALVKNKDRNPS